MKVAVAVLACVSFALIHTIEGRMLHEEVPRFFENCNTTTMRIRNRRRYVVLYLRNFAHVLTWVCVGHRCRYSSGDVYGVSTLKSGQGVIDCSNKCANDPDCWSFDYQKNIKLCFVMSSGNEVSTERATAWSSGHRECSMSGEDNWINAPIDFGSP